MGERPSRMLCCPAVPQLIRDVGSGLLEISAGIRVPSTFVPFRMLRWGTAATLEHLSGMESRIEKPHSAYTRW